MMRKRFLVTVEVFVDSEWLEDQTVGSDTAVDTVWELIDEMLPDTEDVGAAVVRVEKKR